MGDFMKLKIVLALLLLFSLCHTAGAVKVDWYQLAPSGYKKVDFVVPFVKYKAVVKIYSNENRIVDIMIKNDVPFWFDEVIAKKRVELHKGLNVISIPFVLKSWRSRGVFVVVSGIIDVSSVSDRIINGYEIAMSGYYFQGLTMLINGKKYDVDSFPPVPPYAYVVISGNLIGPKARPVKGYKIVAYTVTNDKYETKTTESGSFVISFVTPDWRKEHMCGDRVYLCHLLAIDPEGRIVTSWEVTARCVCEYTPKAKFEVKDIKIIPENPKAGENVLIEADIENVGRTTQTGYVILLIDNFPHHDVKKITLSPMESKRVVWDYVFLYNKPYTITVITEYDHKSVILYVGGNRLVTPTPNLEYPKKIEPQPIDVLPRSTQSNMMYAVAFGVVSLVIVLGWLSWRRVS